MKKIIKATAALTLAASILATNGINALANTTVEDVLEEAYDDLETKEKVSVGTSIIENNDDPKIFKEVIKEVDDLELGDIVNVNGHGNSSSNGLGKNTKVYKNKLMAIVKIDESADYPYGLVNIYPDGSIGDVIEWFTSDAIKARYIKKTITEYADVQKTIINTKDIPDEYTDAWDYLNKYYDYEDGKSIQVKYIWPEVEENYDEVYTVAFKDNVQTREFYNGDEIFYYDYDWNEGTITHTENVRDKIDANLILKLEDKKNL